MLKLFQKYAMQTAMLFAFGLYYFIYIQTTTANVIWQAWFYHTTMIENFFQGTLTLKDLLVPFGEHGMLGYNLIFFINVQWFHLTTFFDAYLNYILVFLSTAIISFCFAKDILKEKEGKFTQYLLGIFLVIITFVMFSITQYSSGAMETQIRIGLFSFFLTSILFHKYLFSIDKTIQRLMIIMVMIYGSIVLFGTFYSFAWIPAFFILGFIHYKRVRSFDKYFYYIYFALLSSVFIYFIMYSQGGSSITQGRYVDQIVSLLADPVKTIKFIMAFLSSSTLGRAALDGKYASDNMLLLNGLIVGILYVYSLILYFKKKMWKTTYLPVIFISYTAFTIFIVTVGRFQMTWTWGTSMWYAVHMKFGLVGCFWILGIDFINRYKMRQDSSWKEWIKQNYRLGITVILIMILMIGLVFSNAIEWKRAPYVKKYFTVMIPYGMDLENMPVDSNGNTPFIAPANETLESLRVAQKYGLSFYHDIKNANHVSEDGVLLEGGTLKSGSLRRGWYAEEKNFRWMSKEASLVFANRDWNSVQIDGFLPDIVSPNEMTIFANGHEIYKGSHTGKFRVKAILPVDLVDSEVTLKIKFNKAVVPKDEGLSEDIRELASTINDIYLVKQTKD